MAFVLKNVSHVFTNKRGIIGHPVEKDISCKTNAWEAMALWTCFLVLRNLWEGWAFNRKKGPYQEKAQGSTPSKGLNPREATGTRYRRRLGRRKAQPYKRLLERLRPHFLRDLDIIRVRLYPRLGSWILALLQPGITAHNDGDIPQPAPIRVLATPALGK